MKRFRPELELRTRNRERSAIWNLLFRDLERFKCKSSGSEFDTVLYFSDRPFRNGAFRLPNVWRKRVQDRIALLRESDTLISATLTIWVYFDTFTASCDADEDHLRFFHECGIQLKWVFLPTQF